MRGARAEVARRLLPALGINSVPVAGVFLAGWDGATALALYWWENLIASLLVALRIVVHRALTRKRGHWRLQLGLETHVESGGAQRPGRRARAAPGDARPGSFLVEFLVAACAATALHGALLWFVVRRVLDEGPQADSLRHGVLAVAGFQLLGLAFDLVGIRDRPFAWIRAIAQTAVQRVTLIHVAVIAGYWFGLTRGGLGAFFGPFAVLKALADVGGVLAALGVSADTEESPRWLAATMNRMAPGKGDFAEHWRARKAQERRLFAEDELERSAASTRATPHPERRRRR